MSAQRFLGCLSAQSLRGGCVSALLPKPRESLIPFCKEHQWVLSKVAPSMFPWQPLSVGKEPRVRIIVSRTKSSRHTGQRKAAWRKSDAQFMWPSQPMSCFRQRNSVAGRGVCFLGFQALAAFPSCRWFVYGCRRHSSLSCWSGTNICQAWDWCSLRVCGKGLSEDLSHQPTGHPAGRKGGSVDSQQMRILQSWRGEGAPSYHDASPCAHHTVLRETPGHA